MAHLARMGQFAQELPPLHFDSATFDWVWSTWANSALGARAVSASTSPDEAVWSREWTSRSTASAAP